MAFSIPTIEPSTHEAGTSLIFKRSFADYPADTWTLTYYINNTTGAVISFSASADSLSHSVSVTASETSTWAPGRYRMQGRVTDGTDTHTAYNGWLTVTPDLTSTPTDTRSHARKMMDAIEEGMLVSAGADVVSYSLNGRTFTRLSWTEAEGRYNYWRSRVRWEERKNPVKIQVMFK